MPLWPLNSHALWMRSCNMRMGIMSVWLSMHLYRLCVTNQVCKKNENDFYLCLRSHCSFWWMWMNIFMNNSSVVWKDTNTWRQRVPVTNLMGCSCWFFESTSAPVLLQIMSTIPRRSTEFLIGSRLLHSDTHSQQNNKQHWSALPYSLLQTGGFSCGSNLGFYVWRSFHFRSGDDRWQSHHLETDGCITIAFH